MRVTVLPNLDRPPQPIALCEARREVAVAQRRLCRLVSGATLCRLVVE
jgi:hypothetical protein